MTPPGPRGEKRPRVSVILPVYDGERYLAATLDSLWSQTFADFEVICIDDGSTDGTAALLAAQSDPRLQVHHQENAGLQATLNRAIALARAPLLARQDADDLSAPERLARQWERMEAEPELVALGTDRRVVDGEDRPLDAPLVHLSDWGLRALAPVRCQFVHGSMMLRRDAVLDAGGYDEAQSVTEDYLLWWRLAARGTLANLGTPLYVFRRHESSVQARRPDELIDQTAALRRRILGEWLRGVAGIARLRPLPAPPPDPADPHDGDRRRMAAGELQRLGLILALVRRWDEAAWALDEAARLGADKAPWLRRLLAVAPALLRGAIRGFRGTDPVFAPFVDADPADYA